MTFRKIQSIRCEITANLKDPRTTATGVFTFLARTIEIRHELHIQALDASLFLHEDSMTRILIKFLPSNPTIDTSDGFTYIRTSTICFAWFRPEPAWIAVTVGQHFTLERAPYPGVILMPTPTPTLHVPGVIHGRDDIPRFCYLRSTYPTLQAIHDDLRLAELISDPRCGLDCHVGVCAHTMAYVRHNLNTYTSIYIDSRFALCARGTDEDKICTLMRALHPLHTFSLRSLDTFSILYQYAGNDTILYIIHSVYAGNTRPTFVLTRRARPVFDHPPGPTGFRCGEVAAGPSAA